MRPNLRRFDAYAVVACAFAYVAVSAWLTRKGTPLAPDSLEYASVARNLVTGRGYTIDLVEIHPGLLPQIRHLHELHGLLHPVILGALFWADGVKASLVHLPGLLFVSGTSVFTFLIARRTFGTAAALLAAGSILLRTDLAFSGALGGDDVGSMFFSAGAFLFAIEANHSTRPSLWLGFAGVSAALCILEKFSGVVVPAVLALGAFAPWSRIRAPRCSWLFVVVPVTLAISMYFVRNHALNGHFGFRFGAIDWLSKDGFGAYFSYYDQGLSLSHVLSQLGWKRALELIFAQVKVLGETAWGCFEVLVAGPLAAVYLTHRRDGLGLYAIAYSIALGFLVCVVYHVEGRYLFVLYPLFCTATWGVTVEVLRYMTLRFAWARARVLRPILWGGATILVCFGIVRVFDVYRALGAWGTVPGACDDAVAFIRNNVPPEESILTSSPWFLNWSADRPAVMAPTNGVDANQIVIRHYDVRWVIDGLPTYGGTDVARLIHPPQGERGLPVELRYTGAVCRVYRLTTPS